MRNFLCFFFLTVFVASVQPQVQAAALLKPTSGATQVLRPRALEVETRISGAWAQTTVTTVFARRGRQNLEADLLLSVPQDAIVTGFSYWAGREKVTARLTEREEAEREGAPREGAERGRAAQISEASGAGAVDSLWARLVGQTVFRAHLHRVVAGRDLRIELQMAQPLRSEGAALIWSYPLPGETRDVTLDWLRVRVQTPDGTRARNNFGAGVAGDELLARKYNFKPKTEARVAISGSAAPLQAQLTSEHSGGAGNGEAYFALALQSAAPLQSLPTLSGVDVFDVLPPQRLSPTEVRILGRYRGKGAATVEWGDHQTIVWFAPPSDAANETPRVAAPLWGAARIAALGDQSGARAQVVALSKRFDLASAWTIWVAIPSKERILIEARLRELDVQKRGAALGRVWAVEVEKKTPLSATALQARAGLRALMRSSIGRRVGFDDETARLTAMKTRLAELGRIVMAGRMNVAPADASSTKRMAELSRYAEVDFHPFLQTAQLSLRQKQVASVKTRWQNEVIALRGGLPLAGKLRAELTTLQNRYGMSDEGETATFRRAARQMAYSVLNEALAGREDQPRAGTLIEAGEGFTRKCGASSFRREFYDAAISENLRKVSAELLTELEAGRDQSAEARDAQNRMRQIYALSPSLRGSLRENGSLEWQIDAARRGLAQETAYRIIETRATRPDDSKTLGELEARLERVSARTEDNAEDFLTAQRQRFNGGQPLVNAHAFRLQENGLDPDADEDSAPSDVEPQFENRVRDPLLSLQLPRDVVRVEAISPAGESQNLAFNAQIARWEARFYAPRSLRDGRSILGLRIVKRDGTSARLTLNLAFDAATNKAQGLKINDALTPDLKWDLGVWSQAPTQRISARLPWGDTIALPAEKSGRFGAEVSVPASWRGKKVKVQFLVVDAAQKLSEISVDWN